MVSALPMAPISVRPTIFTDDPNRNQFYPDYPMICLSARNQITYKTRIPAPFISHASKHMKSMNLENKRFKSNTEIIESTASTVHKKKPESLAKLAEVRIFPILSGKVLYRAYSLQLMHRQKHGES